MPTLRNARCDACVPLELARRPAAEPAGGVARSPFDSGFERGVKGPMTSLSRRLELARAVALFAPALAFALGAAAAQSQLPEPAAPQWTISQAVGAAVDYPSNIFSVDAGPSPQGTGRHLQTADGRADFMFYGSPNDDHESPRSYVRKYLAVPKARLDYVRITDRFFVVSGIEGGRVFYSRCNYPRGSTGPMHCVYLLYPQSETRAWDGIVTHISRSLRPSG